MMLSAAALAGGSGGPVSQVVQRGAKVAGSSLGSAETLGKLSPGAGEIVGVIRGDLAQAAKAAAAAAVSSRIDALSDRLNERAETLRNPVPPAESSDESSQVNGDEQEGGDAASGEHGEANRPARESRGATTERRNASAAEGRPAEGRRAAAAEAGSAQVRRPAREAAGSAPPVRRTARRTSEGR